ncbi:MAG TPA: ABC transporter permease, partial [Eudoraea sp.]|nr:ABC transporter permease [Eudoraea sp.]
MIRNHFKIAIRNLIRRKRHSIINIGGLAVGIAVCLLIFVIIQFDLSYDDYHQKKDKIYRVLTEYHHNEPEIFYGKGVPYALPEAIKTAIPQIEESAVVFMDRDTQIIVLDDNGHSVSKFKEPTGVFFTEPALFSVFDFKWLAGTPDSLKDPNSVVLSKETAIKYFGGWQQAIGKNIKWNNEEVLNVSGILEEVPPNSELQFNVVIAYGTAFTADMKTSDNWDGTNGSFGCFVLLPDDATEAVVNAQLAALARENKSEEVRDSQV